MTKKPTPELWKFSHTPQQDQPVEMYPLLGPEIWLNRVLFKDLSLYTISFGILLQTI